MSATAVEIPESIGGVPVTKIGIYAFNGCAVKSVTIPDTVTEIGSYAFSMCKSLTSVKLPSGLEKVGVQAFSQCPALETVEFPDKVVEFSSNVFKETPWLSAQREKSPLVIVNGVFQRWLLRDKTAELKNWEAADLCQDNRLDVYDLVLMRKSVVNK